MIVAERGDRFDLVTQPDHAALAGQFADRWGGHFERPAPRAAMAIAAYHHDVGWEAYDRRPHLDADGRPVDFRDMPPGTWIDLYESGIDAVVDLDPYAGLLVSMHGAGLRNRRYGLSPSWPATPDAFAGFVEREERRQARLLEALREDEHEAAPSAADADLLATLHDSGAPPAEHDSRLWADYVLLQAWDAFSLAFCTAGDPSSIGPVPAGEGTATLSIEPLGDDAFRVEPYPFDRSPLVASVPTRAVEKSAFDDGAGLVRAYYEAPRETRDLEFRSPGQANR